MKDAAARMAESIRISQVHFDLTGVPPLAPALRQLVREFLACRRNGPPADGRRAFSRRSAQLDVSVLPLNENWTPLARPLIGTVIELMPRGLGMVTSQAVESEHVALQIHNPATVVQIIAKVVWDKDIGQGLHNSVLRFLLRFGCGSMAGESDRSPAH